MDAWVSRRRMLALSAAAILAPGLLSCSNGNGTPESTAEDNNDDPPDLSSFGYDPDTKESANTETPKHAGQVGPKASVKAEWLPPVGNQQNVRNCFVWASAYGLATFNAARKSKTPPTSADRVAGPDYAYIRYQMAKNMPGNTCKGSQVGSFLDWLKSNGGTPSLAAAPNHTQKTEAASCSLNWSKHGSQTIAPDSRFVVDYKATKITGTDGLKNLRTVLAAGSPVAFGTRLYTDFKPYTKSLYVGNGELLMEGGKKAGHAMLIIGYDDTYADNKGAVRIRNSWGKKWGEKGHMWMAYDTLEKLAEGTGFYAPESA